MPAFIAKPRSKDLVLPGTAAGLVALALIALRWHSESRRPSSPPDETSKAATPLRVQLPVDARAREVEALGRVLASESASGTLEERSGIGWTVRNRATKYNTSIFKMECCPWRPQSGSNPPFSSARPARPIDTALAVQILAEPVEKDPTHGATAFFEPALQDLLTKWGKIYRAKYPNGRPMNPSYFFKQANGKPIDISRFYNYKKTADEVRARWIAGGERRYTTIGRFEFWGKTSRLAV